MHATRQAKTSSPAASRWPNLLHKYRKLAIPAVVAAVMPDGGALRRAEQPGEGDNPEREQRSEKEERR